MPKSVLRKGRRANDAARPAAAGSDNSRRSKPQGGNWASYVLRDARERALGERLRAEPAAPARPRRSHGDERLDLAAERLARHRRSQGRRARHADARAQARAERRRGETPHAGRAARRCDAGRARAGRRATRPVRGGRSGTGGAATGRAEARRSRRAAPGRTHRTPEPPRHPHIRRAAEVHRLRPSRRHRRRRSSSRPRRATCRRRLRL
jgi:hypothetical protein